MVGALVLGHSLRDAGIAPGRRMICLVAEGRVSQSSLDAIQSVWEIRQVPLLDSHDSARLAVLGRPELGQSLTKLHVWNLPLGKAIFLDADMLILQPIEDLFNRPELSACPDVGWPDCFNSGLFVCEPREATFAALLEHAKRIGSFDGTFY